MVWASFFPVGQLLLKSTSVFIIFHGPPLRILDVSSGGSLLEASEDMTCASEPSELPDAPGKQWTKRRAPRIAESTDRGQQIADLRVDPESFRRCGAGERGLSVANGKSKGCLSGWLCVWHVQIHDLNKV